MLDSVRHLVSPIGDHLRHAFERATHLKAAPGWLVTAMGVGGDVWQHHALTVLSALAILTGIAYHATLIACAVVKTRHEVRELAARRHRSAWDRYLNHDSFDGLN